MAWEGVVPMRTPPPGLLELAALWLENNEGDERTDCLKVARWLRHQAQQKELRDVAREGGVSVSALRRKLAGRIEPADELES